LITLRALLSSEEFAPLFGKLTEHLDEIFTRKFFERYISALKEKISALSGKRVYFFGFGAAYEYYKKMLTGIHPVKILVSMIPESGLPKWVDGIEVEFLHNAFSGDRDDQPAVIIFARKAHVSTMIDNLAKAHDRYAQGNNCIPCILFENMGI
jgi:hypothetical protein